MEHYCLNAVIYESPTLKTYEAWSKKCEKDVIVKVYKCSGITTSESLLREAVRQAREKPVESAALIDVALSAADSRGTDESFCVNFVLEKKERYVARGIIERDDGRGLRAQGLVGYQTRGVLYAQQGKKVELAFSFHLGKDVVIKSQECFFVLEANSLLREAFALAYVEHAYTCRLLDLALSQETQYSFRLNLIMEKFDRDVSEDIRDRMRRGSSYSEAELLDFLRDVTRGLAHAKSLVSPTQYVAHRDIKPQNIFLSADGKYKLGDFGSAWKKAQGTQVSTAAGTEVYMSPEMQLCMFEPEANRVDAFLSDVYSLGVTVLHMAARRLPLVTSPIRAEQVGDISDEALRLMAAADPALKAHRDCEDIRQKVREMLAKDIFLGVRLNIIRSAQETLGSVPYSEGFKQLVSDMVAVDPLRRIRLDNVIGKVEDLRSAVTSGRKSMELSTRQGSTQVFPKLLGISDEGTLRLFDLQSTSWGPPLLHREMHIDSWTCYTLISDTVAVLCGSDVHLDGYGEGVEVYQVELRGLAVSELPNFPARRVAPGLFHHDGSLLAFGGKDSVRRDAIRLSLSPRCEWAAIRSQMSEGKYATTPCQLNLKVYICGRKVDLFNLQASAFEPPLALVLPEECAISFFSGYELVVISWDYTVRIAVNKPSMRKAEHEEHLTISTSPVTLREDSALWIRGNTCHIVAFESPTRFRVVKP